jgi:hypothetical protein
MSSNHLVEVTSGSILSSHKATVPSSAPARRRGWSVRLTCVASLCAVAVAVSDPLAADPNSSGRGDAGQARQSDESAQYRAYALLRLSFQAPRLLSDRSGAALGNKDDFEIFRRTQAVICSSRTRTIRPFGCPR